MQTYDAPQRSHFAEDLPTILTIEYILIGVARGIFARSRTSTKVNIPAPIPLIGHEHESGQALACNEAGLSVQFRTYLPYLT